MGCQDEELGGCLVSSLCLTTFSVCRVQVLARRCCGREESMRWLSESKSGEREVRSGASASATLRAHQRFSDTRLARPLAYSDLSVCVRRDALCLVRT